MRRTDGKVQDFMKPRQTKPLDQRSTLRCLRYKLPLYYLEVSAGQPPQAKQGVN